KLWCGVGSGVNSLIANLEPPVFRGFVGAAPDFLAGRAIQTIDGVSAIGIAQRIETTANYQRRRCAMADFLFPERFIWKPVASIPAGVFLDDVIAKRASPVRPVFGHRR